jgi:hypothetical protein
MHCPTLECPHNHFPPWVFNPARLHVQFQNTFETVQEEAHRLNIKTPLTKVQCKTNHSPDTVWDLQEADVQYDCRDFSVFLTRRPSRFDSWAPSLYVPHDTILAFAIATSNSRVFGYRRTTGITQRTYLGIGAEVNRQRPATALSLAAARCADITQPSNGVTTIATEPISMAIAQ